MPKLFGKRSKPPALAAGRVFEVTSSEIGGSTTLLSNSSSDAPEDSHADSEEALVLALKDQVGDLDVAQSYTNKLRDRTGGPPSKELGHCVVRAAEAGALEALVAAMAAHAYDAAVQDAGLEAVRNLTRVVMPPATTFIRPRALSAGVVEAAVGAMGTVGLTGLCTACSLLINLTVADDDTSDAAVKRAADAGAVAAIVRALRDHGGDQQLSEKGAGAIGNLCSHADAEVLSKLKDGAVDAGAVEALVKALSTHPTAADVGTAVVKALANLAMPPASAAQLGAQIAAAAPAALVQSAGRHAAEEELIDYTILALDALADGGPVAVRDAGARGVVEGAIKRFPTNEDIMDQSRSLMQKIGLGSAMDANKGGPVAGPGEFRL